MNNRPLKSITPTELYELIQDGLEIDLIDVRPRKMYDFQHVEQAEFVEFKTLDPAAIVASRILEESAPIYIICQLGIRSVEACKQFMAAGFDNVINLEGGTKEWVIAGLPTIRTHKKFAEPFWARIRRWLFPSANKPSVESIGIPH